MADFNLIALVPEIILLVMGCVVLLADAMLKDAQRAWVERLSLISVALVFGALVWQAGGPAQTAFGGTFVVDALSAVLKMASAIALFIALVYARRYNIERPVPRGEFQVIALFALLGQMVMMSAANMLVMYLGLELMSLSLYALAAMRRDDRAASEAAMKYFVLGALASGFMLYGMSMLYGASGSLDLSDINLVSRAEQDKTFLVFGLVFIVGGLAFKFGAVPFHMWVPDVYQGTPTGATLLIATGPKLASFAMAYRLLVEGLPGVVADWQHMMLILAGLSLAFGNLIAIAQTNLKRMLAYSGIAQVGFVLLGLIAGMVDGSFQLAPLAYGSSMFYIMTYVITTLGTFGLIALLARSGFECEAIEDLKGLHKRSPWMALVMLLLMFSLAGIPPTVGFYAKLIVLEAVIVSGHLWIAVFAVMMSLIGAFYYLRIVKTMYFDSPTDISTPEPAADGRFMLGLNGIAVVVLGLLPGPLLTLCVEAIQLSMVVR
ncbi:MAG: NADH-quinone oxidoreductase subunit NuoN [Burkholderiales bacterium]|jgi:NADH-quinone oxidoreductase subunit N